MGRNWRRAQPQGPAPRQFLTRQNRFAFIIVPGAPGVRIAQQSKDYCTRCDPPIFSGKFFGARLNRCNVSAFPPEAKGYIARGGQMIAAHLVLKIPDRQAILETTAVNERLEKVLGLMATTSIGCYRSRGNEDAERGEPAGPRRQTHPRLRRMGTFLLYTSIIATDGRTTSRRSSITWSIGTTSPKGTKRR
jgi:hypothetical protein